LKDEALRHIQWRARFGRGYGPVVRLRDDDYGPDVWGPQGIRIEFLDGKFRGVWAFTIETY